MSKNETNKETLNAKIKKFFSGGKELGVDNMFGFKKVVGDPNPVLAEGDEENKKLLEELGLENFDSIVEEVLSNSLKGPIPESMNINEGEYKKIHKYFKKEVLSDIALDSMAQETKDYLDAQLRAEKLLCKNEYDGRIESLYFKNQAEIYEFSRRLRNVLFEFEDNKIPIEKSAIAERFMNRFGANYGMTHILADVANSLEENRKSLGIKKGEFNKEEFLYNNKDIYAIGIDPDISPADKKKIAALAAGMISSLDAKSKSFRNDIILTIRVAEMLVKNNSVNDINEEYIDFGKFISMYVRDTKLGDSIYTKTNQICQQDNIKEIKTSFHDLRENKSFITSTMSWLKRAIFGVPKSKQHTNRSK